MLPTWLPNKIVFNGFSITSDYAKLYAIFEADLKPCSLAIESLPVVIDLSTDSYMPQYERGFTHLVTRDDGNGTRTIDYERAAMLNWVKPVIENYNEPEVYAFWYTNPQGRALYLWLADYDFVVILKPLRSSSVVGRIIVTAYHVDPFRRKDLTRRYGKASQIL